MPTTPPKPMKKSPATASRRPRRDMAENAALRDENERHENEWRRDRSENYDGAERLPEAAQAEYDAVCNANTRLEGEKRELFQALTTEKARTKVLYRKLHEAKWPDSYWNLQVNCLEMELREIEKLASSLDAIVLEKLK